MARKNKVDASLDFDDNGDLKKVERDAKKAGKDTKAIIQIMGDMLKAEKLNK